MSAQHTPGPWRALYTRVDDASGYQVCHGDLHGKGEATNAANLRLIAAAPDLLAALIAIYDRHNAETMSQARAAIAKATA
jgi:hypothetical protein